MTLLLGILFLFISVGGGAAAPVERTIAIVNGELLFLSDLQRQKTFLSLLEIDEPLPMGDLVARKLLNMEAHRFLREGPSPDEVDASFIRIQGMMTPGRFKEALDETGLVVATLKELVTEHLWIKKFIAERITAFVFVSPKEIEQYRQDHPTLFLSISEEEVPLYIQKILIQEKSMESLKGYVIRLRAKGQIQINMDHTAP